MWQEIRSVFQTTPSRLKVVEKLLESGFKVLPDGIYAGDVQLSTIKLARACGVDRKVVEETARDIRSNPLLLNVFQYLKPVADISDIAKYNKSGFGGLIEIEAISSSVGIASKVSTMISEEGLVIRYLLAKDPEISVRSTMTVVTDEPIPMHIIQQLLNDPNILKVSLS